MVMVYDAVHNMTRQTVGIPSDGVEADGATTTMIHDDRNRVIERTDPLSRTTYTEYDGVGNVVKMTDPMGFASTFVYNKNGWPVREINALNGETVFGYDAEGAVTAITNPNDHTAHFEYDLVGQRVKVTDTKGQVTTFGYDKVGNQISVTNASGNTTIYTYNELNLHTKIQDPLGNLKQYEYDELQRLISITDANGKITYYDYNALGWLTSVTDAEGNVTTYKYDEVGNRTAIIDANGVRTTFEYNFLDQLKREINPLGDTWEYSYDARGNMIRRVDGKWQATYYEYDKANQLVATVYGEGATSPTDVGASAVTFEYDANGNEIAMHDWNGDWTYTYDKLNRRTSATDYLSRTLEWEYDAVGNRTAMIYPDGQRVEIDYDAADQLESLTDFENRVHTWDYDPLGYIEAQVNPNNTQAEYEYDATGRLTSLTNTGAGGSVIASYAYTLNAVGNRVQTVEQRAAHGALETVTRSYSYDDLYRLTRAQTNTGQDMRYVYDPVGNRTQKMGVPEPVEGQPQEPEDTPYTFNDLNSMLTAGPTAFDYDDNGNRMRETEPLTASDYLSAALSLGADVTGTVVTDYVYDYENRLTEVSRDLHYTVTLELGSLIMAVPYISPTMEAEYVYDSYGRRVEKHVTTYMTGTTVFTTPTVFAREYGFDSLDPVYEYDYEGDTVTPTLTSAYIYGNGRMVFMERTEGGASETYWYHYDGLGSVVALTDEAGADVCQWKYDEYGNPLQDCPKLNHYTYTGQEYDVETGFTHFFARYYDAETGVWISQDKYRGDMRAPLTLHRSMYVFNNPIRLIDLHGFESELPEFSTMWDAYDDIKGGPGDDDDPLKVIGLGDWIRGVDVETGGTCAVRMSYVLNYSGAEIPFLGSKAKDPDNQGTVKGANDGKNYMYEVPTFKKYMTDTYGEPEILSREALQGRKGMIAFFEKTDYHADLYDGTKDKCVNQCYFDAYDEDVLFWEAPSPSSSESDPDTEPNDGSDDSEGNNGLGTGAMVGTGGGVAVGAAIGFGVAGPVGAAVGGIVGGVAGGLIGSLFD